LLLSEFWRSALALTFWLATGSETRQYLGQIAIVGLVVYYWFIASPTI